MTVDPSEPVIIFRGSEMVLLDSPETLAAILNVIRQLIALPGVALAYGSYGEASQWVPDAAKVPALGPAFEGIVREWMTAANVLPGQPANDAARAALSNVRKNVMQLALRAGDVRRLQRDAVASDKTDDLPAGISLYWHTIGAEDTRVYQTIRVSIWVASGSTGLARLQPVGWPQPTTPAASQRIYFWLDRLRDLLAGFQAGMGGGRGFWQLTIGGRNVELPRFTTVWPTPLPHGVESYVSDESQLRLLCRRYLIGGDPLSAEVSGSVLEGNFLTLRRTSAIVKGSAQELYVLAPFTNGDENSGELDREHHLITNQWERLYLSLIGELLAGKTSGKELDRVEGSVLRMESAVGRLETALTRIQTYLAAKEAETPTTRASVREAAADRRRTFDLAGVLLERMHRVRPRLIVLSSDLGEIESAARQAIDRTIAEFKRQLTTRPVAPFSQGTIEATREWEPVVTLRARVEALNARGRDIQSRMDVLTEATNNILETERREEGRRSGERQTHLGEALALMALLTAVPLIIGSVDPGSLAAAVATVVPGSQHVVLAIQPILTVISLVAAFIITGVLLQRFFRKPTASRTFGGSIAKWGRVLSGRGQPWTAAAERRDRAALLAEDERISKELAAYLDSLGSEKADGADEIEMLERSIERHIATVDLPLLVADMIPLARTAALLCFRGIDGNGIIAPGQFRRSLVELGFKTEAINELIALCRDTEARLINEVAEGGVVPAERAKTMLAKIEARVAAAS